MASTCRRLLSALIAIIPITAFSQNFYQEKPESSYYEYAKTTIAHDAKHIFNLGISFVQAPIYFDSEDWQYALYSGAITSTLFLTDRSIKKLIPDFLSLALFLKFIH